MLSVFIALSVNIRMFGCRNRDVCVWLGGAAADRVDILRNMRYVYRITILKCEKLWIPKHILSQEFRIRVSGPV